LIKEHFIIQSIIVNCFALIDYGMCVTLRWKWNWGIIY